jgi:hypothetical protein
MHLIVSFVPNFVKFFKFSNNLPNFICNFVLDKTQTRELTSLSTYCRRTAVRADKGSLCVVLYTSIVCAQ